MATEKTILLAEDEEMLHLVAKKIIESMNYKVISAFNGEEAVSAYKENPVIDLVILDICLPGKDGIETLSEIMELNKKLPVIINSAYGTYKDNFMTWSADAYVVKSSDLSELKTTIRALLDKKNVEA